MTVMQLILLITIVYTMTTLIMQVTAKIDNVESTIGRKADQDIQKYLLKGLNNSKACKIKWRLDLIKNEICFKLSSWPQLGEKLKTILQNESRTLNEKVKIQDSHNNVELSAKH